MVGTEDAGERGGEASVIGSPSSPKEDHGTDAPIRTKRLRRVIESITNDVVVIPVIVINALIFVALDIDPDLVQKTGAWLNWVDYICVLYFAVELILKVYLYGFKGYIKLGWFNRLDFIIVIASLPILFEPFLPDLAANTAWAPLFRTARLLRLTRFLRTARLLSFLQKYTYLIPLKMPSYIIITIVASNIIIIFLDLSGGWKFWYDQFYGPTLLFVTTWLVSRIYSVIHERFVKAYFDKRAEDTIGSADSIIAALVQICIWATGISMTLELAGYDSTSILAGLGLGGMAVALAAQDTIGNLIGGVLLYLNKPFKIGDGIEINNMKGTVRKLGLRNITIVDAMGSATTLPNKIFIATPLKNNAAVEFLEGRIALKMDINLPANKLKKAIDVISEIATEYEHIHDEYTLGFGDMSDYCHNLEFVYFLNKKSLRQANPSQPNYILITDAKKNLYVEIVEQLARNEISFYSAPRGLIPPHPAAD